MKVRNLLAALQHMDPDARVIVEESSCAFEPEIQEMVPGMVILVAGDPLSEHDLNREIIHQGPDE